MNAFEILIDTPAWLFGHVLGAVIILAVTVAGAVAGFYVGAYVHRALPIPFARTVLAIIIGLWIAIIPVRALTWAGVTLVQFGEGTNDD